jgi:Zn-finger nucleic acid-binding protein
VLRRIQYEGLTICTCPGCNGEFLDGKQVKYIERKQEIQFDRSERNRLLYGKTGPEKEKRLVCPRCGNDMSKGRYRKTEVIIDHCKSCSGVWLDDQELEKIQVLGEAGKTGDASRTDNRPGLAEAVMGARAIASKQAGESTEAQGFVATVSNSERTFSIPKLPVRVVCAGLCVFFLLAWLSGHPYMQAPLKWMFGEESQPYLPAILASLAVVMALTYKKVTIKPDRGLEIRYYIIGIPWTRTFPKEDLKCIGTDYEETIFYERRGVYAVLELVLHPRYWWFLPGSRRRIGYSYLYVVLKSGKRIKIYKGEGEDLGELADFLRAGLKLKLRRL